MTINSAEIASAFDLLFFRISDTSTLTNSLTSRNLFKIVFKRHPFFHNTGHLYAITDKNCIKLCNTDIAFYRNTVR